MRAGGWGLAFAQDEEAVQPRVPCTEVVRLVLVPDVDRLFRLRACLAEGPPENSRVGFLRADLCGVRDRVKVLRDTRLRQDDRQVV